MTLVSDAAATAENHRKLLADAKVKAEKELYKAKERAREHCRSFTEPEIKRLEKLLLPKIGREHIQFTAAVDERFYDLDPEHPFPVVLSHQYTVHKDEYGGLSVQYWHATASWDGPYSPGKPGWKHANYHHKYSVLAYLAQNLPPVDPTTMDGAMLVLIELAEKLAEEKKLTRDEIAALNTVQCSRRDQAMYRDRHF